MIVMKFCIDIHGRIKAKTLSVQVQNVLTYPGLSETAA